MLWCLYRDLALRTSRFSNFGDRKTIAPHASLGFQKHTRSTSSSGTTAAAAVQHIHRTSRGLMFMGSPVFPLCNSRHPRDLTFTTSGRGTLHYYVEMRFFCTSAFFSLPAGGLSSCSRLRGTQGARPKSTAQVWTLVEVCGTCSGGSKSRKLASNHGEAFRAHRALSLIHI